jgi:N-acetylglucosaminyl-diphospho-decaprenol L-rhamnosyltransferase
MDLSIVIASWNTRELLARCLSSVYETVNDLEFEVIVVDNASTDGSQLMVRRHFPRVQLIENSENVGFARANNQGIRHSTGRNVLLLNSDTEVQPAALERLVKVLDTRPEVGAAGPRVLNPDGTLQNSYGSLPSVLSEIIGPYRLHCVTKPWGRVGRLFMGNRLDSNAPMRVDRVSFACTLIGRKALQQIGMLDERYGFYSEDYDWFKRLKDAGWLVLFYPQAQILHHWGASSRQRSVWAASQLYRSKRLYFAKHYGVTAEKFLRIGLTVQFATKILLTLITYPIGRSTSLQRIELHWKLIEDMLGAI